MGEVVKPENRKVVAVIAIALFEDGEAVLAEARGPEYVLKGLLVDGPRLIDEAKVAASESRIVKPVLVPPKGVF